MLRSTFRHNQALEVGQLPLSSVARRLRMDDEAQPLPLGGAPCSQCTVRSRYTS